MKQTSIYRQICVFIFIITLSYQAFQKTLIVSDYYINTANYIANCINKAEPEMHCDGKCQLVNKLEETKEDNSKMPDQSIHQFVEIILFFDDLDAFNYLNFETNSKSFYASHSSKTIDRPHPIFRPPII